MRGKGWIRYVRILLVVQYLFTDKGTVSNMYSFEQTWQPLV